MDRLTDKPHCEYAATSQDSAFSGDLIAFIVDCSELAVECGDAQSLRAHLCDDRWRSDIEQEALDEKSPFRPRIIRAKEALLRMEAVEAVHGIGSALVVNHPFNIKLAAYGLLGRIAVARERATLATD
ncbi:hypothetical protein NKH57_02135 [Mesorhizobium sp. M1050]|uniref:hypothetical protein n=1 Tax=Mesorhizobium sp. M1050 TaxID=2957051 RepID=UPI00333AB4A2